MSTLYTRADTEVDSSLVYEAYYNDNSGDLAVVLDGGHGYLYENVPANVYEGLVNAGSPGAYFGSQIKRTYGPSTRLGYVGYDNDIEFVEVQKPAAVGTPKGLTVATGANDSSRFPLSLAPNVEVGNGRKHTVVFESNGRTFTHSPNVNSVDEAVAAFVELSSATGVNLKVKQVVVSFE